MPLNKIILKNQEEFVDIVDPVSSTKISLNGAKTFSAQINVVASSPSGASVFLEKSNDGINWVFENDSNGDPVNESISGSGTFYLERVDPTAIYMRVSFDIDSGSMDANIIYLVKGYN